VLILMLFRFSGSDEGPGVHTVELIQDEADQAETSPILPVVVPASAVRLGSPTEHLRGAVGEATLKTSAQRGTAIADGDAARQQHLASNDSRDLRQDPYTHPDRALASRRPNRSQITTRDSQQDLLDAEPTPFMTRTGRSTTRQSPAPTQRNNPQSGAVRAARSALAIPIVGQGVLARDQSAGPGREIMSRIPKDGALALAPTNVNPREASGIRSRQPLNARSRPSRRDQASNRLLPDIMDMARPRGKGAGLGGGSGSLRGRRGDTRGSIRGQLLWLSTGDRRYSNYFRKIYRKVNPLWLFPKRLQIQMEQGDVLVQFTILSDGQVANAKIRKSSGYPEFDENVLVAIRKAAPFGPIPTGLGKRLKILAPFEFSNPMVQ
jgi:TonB family protein